MKKTVIEQPTLCYRDAAFENQTRQQLETARQLMQGLLDIWNGLDIGEASNLNELLFYPERLYNSAINKIVAPPESGGKFTLNKAKYLDNLDLPDPTRLYQAAKSVRQQSYCAVMELWDLKRNEVVLKESEALVYINSQNIYGKDTKQVEFCKKITTLIDALNEADEALHGTLLAPPMIRQGLMGKFQLIDRDAYRYKIAIIPAVLRQWLNEIN